MTDKSDQGKTTVWRPTIDAPEKPGTYINVRTTTTYRWLAYKPSGAQQMKKPRRWQRATERGWENAALPEGEFIFTPKSDAEHVADIIKSVEHFK